MLIRQVVTVVKKIISANVMRESDKACILSGTSGIELVRRAAFAIFSAFNFSAYSDIAIYCGVGNNGADGMALALLLRSANIPCRVINVGEPRSNEARYFFSECLMQNITCSPLSDIVTDGAMLIVDCIFGTGFHGFPSGDSEVAIHMINAAKERDSKVISIDIPSGLSGNSGLGDTFVRADITLSIGTLKYGHVFGHGKDAVGELADLDIGIPIVGEYSELCEACDFASVIPKRENNCHKGTFGYITLLGGCTNYSGAVKLAENASASLRSGCGVCRVAIARSTVSLIAPRLLDATLTTIDDDGGNMIFDKDGIDRAMQGISALGVGMGWGNGRHCGEILAYIIKTCKVPLLIDADGLNTLSRIGMNALRDAHCPIVLTPHPKEFERLSGVSVRDTLSDPVNAAKRFASGFNNVTLLLKGSSTVITDGKECCIIDRGCAGMAVGGSGDVLSGIITSLLGYSTASIVKTVACGAWIAGRAGEMAQNKTNPVSMIASDTVGSIQDAVSEIYAYHK